MYSICIKFKPELNWRPLCRKFETKDACIDYINEAFEKWDVQHVSVFLDGQFLKCFWFSPKQRAEIHNAVMMMRHNKYKLYGNYNFR